MGNEAWSKVTAFPLWAEAMAAATGGNPKGWMPAANDQLMCLKTGCLATQECRRDPGNAVVIAPDFVSLIKTPCAGHSGTASPQAQILSMEKEVMPVAPPEKAAAGVPQNVKPLAPAGPALIGEDPYGAFAASRQTGSL